MSEGILGKIDKKNPQILAIKWVGGLHESVKKENL